VGISGSININFVVFLAEMGAIFRPGKEYEYFISMHKEFGGVKRDFLTSLSMLTLCSWRSVPLGFFSHYLFL
jgi:hypothetical protein